LSGKDPFSGYARFNRILARAMGKCYAPGALQRILLSSREMEKKLGPDTGDGPAEADGDGSPRWRHGSPFQAGPGTTDVIWTCELPDGMSLDDGSPGFERGPGGKS